MKGMSGMQKLVVAVFVDMGLPFVSQTATVSHELITAGFERLTSSVFKKMF